MGGTQGRTGPRKTTSQLDPNGAATPGLPVRDILESVTDGFVALDSDWCYVFVNARAAELLGRRGSVGRLGTGPYRSW